MTEIVERLERQAVNVENDGHVSAARAMREAATALEEARAEIERQNKRLDLLAVGFGVPDGGRYIADWQTRIKKYQDQAAEIERLRNEADKYCAWWREERDKRIALRARVREVVGPFAEIRQALELISANKPGDELLDERAIFQTWGLKDTPTSKQITLGHLRAARQLMEEVK